MSLICSDFWQTSKTEMGLFTIIVDGSFQIGQSHLRTTWYSLASLTSQFFLGNRRYDSTKSQMGHTAFGTRFYVSSTYQAFLQNIKLSTNMGQFILDTRQYIFPVPHVGWSLLDTICYVAKASQRRRSHLSTSCNVSGTC